MTNHCNQCGQSWSQHDVNYCRDKTHEGSSKKPEPSERVPEAPQGKARTTTVAHDQTVSMKSKYPRFNFLTFLLAFGIGALIALHF